MLVTIQTPTVLGPLTVYNNTWLLPAGTPSTSVNARGGLTLAANTDPGADKWDANPEAIEVGEPLDETFVPQGEQRVREIKYMAPADNRTLRRRCLGRRFEHHDGHHLIRVQ